MKVLNLYAGIGGNRKLWKNVEVTAVEINPEIAAAYKLLFPEDKVIVGDAHKYLLDHFADFNFIWSSPPCPTHSKLRRSHPESICYIDAKLYQEITLLKHWFKGAWVVENVEPYYEALEKESIMLDRHFFWSNFKITNIILNKPNTDVSRDTKEGLAAYKEINISNINIKDKRLLLRNAVHPKIGEHIFNCAFKTTQQTFT